MAHDPDCLFCKIDKGEIPSEKLFEDGRVYVIADIQPAAPVHLLIIPHDHTPTLLDLADDEFDIVGHVFKVACRLAKDNGVAEQGFRLVHNVNEWGGQRVFHLHFHLLDGKKYD